MWNDDEIKKVIYREKQDKMIHDTEVEIRKLEKERNLLLKEYDRKIENLVQEKADLLGVSYIDKDISFQVIAYLVSQIEKVSYHYVESEIILYETVFHRNLTYASPVEYKLAYLVQEGKETLAYEEINKRFKIKISDLDYYAGSKQLENPSEYYIQLAYFKDKDRDKICYQYKNSICISSSSSNRYGFDSCICDERYSYIVDFMNEVVHYRLDKEDLSISLDEMMMLADNFIQSYKECKSGKHLKLQKKSLCCSFWGIVV